MIEHLKPIETHYKGYRFRSRLEARWAIFFDVLKIDWNYELDGYSLPCGPYLPDFWLPQVRMFAEVKAGKFTDDEITRCMQLCCVSGHPVLLLDGIPSARTYFQIEIVEYHKGCWDAYCQQLNIQECCQYWIREGRFYSDPLESLEAGCDVEGAVFEGPLCYTPMNIIGHGKAIAAARSARFEHGEKPKL